VGWFEDWAAEEIRGRLVGDFFLAFAIFAAQLRCKWRTKVRRYPSIQHCRISGRIAPGRFTKSKTKATSTPPA